VSNTQLVTTLDLDQRSESLAMKSTLPVLVRRPILAPCPSPVAGVGRYRMGLGRTVMVITPSADGGGD
jgi:hypothetical protein